MLERIKLKIFNISRKEKGLLLLIVAFAITLPFFSEAAIGTGIFDLFSTMLEGISEKVSPFFAFYVALLMGLIISGLFLYLAVFLLEMAANPANLTIMESEAVQIGWQFTSSLANTGIIVVLVIIGIATILGKDNYGIKKALPKLIIVALLVNFSLVFVGMIVDVANIVLNTFFQEDIGTELVRAIFVSWDNIFGSMTLYGLGLLVSLMIPFQSAVAQFSFALGMTSTLLPQIIEAILQVVVSFMMAIVVSLYAFLFLARIFVIQILAILSPLAFVAWTLPKTQGMWKKWISALVEWSFLGVVLFFFLLLATVAAAPLRPDPGMAPSLPIANFGTVQSIFIYYIILGAFLVLGVKMAKSFMPEGAQTLINQAKGLPGQVRKYGAPMAGPAFDKIREESWRKAREENVEGKGGLRQQAKEATGFKSLTAGANLKLQEMKRSYARAQGSTAEDKHIEAKEKRADMYKGYSKEELKKLTESNMSDSQKGLAVSAYLKAGKDLDPGLKKSIAGLEEHIDKGAMKEAKKKNPDLIYYKHGIDEMESKLENLKIDGVPEDQQSVEYKKLKEEVVKAKKKVKEEVSKMSGKDGRDVDFSSMKKEHAGDIAALLVQSTSIMQSFASGSLKDKIELEKALHNYKGDYEKDAQKALNEFFSDPKNISKWGTGSVKNP